jgi:hypothetical protein
VPKENRPRQGALPVGEGKTDRREDGSLRSRWLCYDGIFRPGARQGELMLRFHCPCCDDLFLVPVGSEGMWVVCPNNESRVRISGTAPSCVGDWPHRANVRILWQCVRRKVSERKARLFACACLQRHEGLLDAPYGPALTAYESHADGRISAAELEAATATARRPGFSFGWRGGRERTARRGVADLLEAWDGPEAVSIAIAAGRSVAEWDGLEAIAAENEAQSELLRDVFGDLLAPVSVEPEWRDWNGATVVKMARTIHDEGAFGDLPVLADALEDAGCEDRAILSHCRQEPGHVPGCWVVDALLGKW